MFTFWLFTIIVILLGLFYLRARIEEKITLREIKEMNPDWKKHRAKKTIVVDRIIEYTGKIINILLLPFVAIFRYPELQPYEQQKDIDRWIKVRIRVGGIIIYIMAIRSIFISIFYAVWLSVYGQIFVALLYVLIQTALSIALIRGWNWARILFGLVPVVLWGYIFQYFAFSVVLRGLHQVGETPLLIWAVSIVGLIGGVLLLYSKSVKYYIYYKRERIRKI